MKTLISILLLFTALSCAAQFHNVKGVRIVERTTAADSTTISGVGQIQYDGSDDKFRFNDGSGWFSFLKEGASMPYWPLSGSATITGNTTISSDGNIIRLKSGDSGFTQADSIYLSSDLSTDVGPIVGVTTDWSSLNVYGIIGYLDENIGGETAFLKIGGIATSPHAWSFYDYRTSKKGIVYENPDTTDWSDNTLSTKKYVVDHVDSKIDAASANFWNDESAPTLSPPSGVYLISGTGIDFRLNVDTVEVSVDQEFIAGGVGHKKIYNEQQDNSAGGSPLSDTQLIDFWITFLPSQKVVTTIKVTATAGELSTGDGYYSSEKIFIFLKDDDDSLSLLDSTTIFSESDDVTADHVMTANSGFAQLAVTTPANTDYQWMVTVQVFHSLVD
jgi:hypothetical protein